MSAAIALPDRARFERLSSALDDLLELDPGARAARLEALGASEPGLAAELSSLLLAIDSDGPLARSAAELGAPLFDRERGESEARGRKGERVGPFVLGGEIGRGGMGAVYAAERAEGGFAQSVAVKIVKRGLDTDEILARFAAERRILARLEHPHIARLVDGGLTADGLPWFAMERIEGRPIDEAAASFGLDRAARLRLFLETADAVAFAHRQLVVHRDLKPSNVLVDARGSVKLLDFGIAKLLADDGGEVKTRTAAAPMTPAFAAPEQARGEVSTLTDVYQLGRLLEQLVPAPRPTDLERIVARARHEAPERRYRSVEALADDVQRFLDGRPVEARGDDALYRVARFVRRHRVAVAASAAVVAALVAGLALALVQARRAQNEAARAEAVRDFLVGLFEASSPVEAQGRDPRASELLAGAPARIERELAGRPEIAAGLLEVIGRIHGELGAFAEGERHYREAIELRLRDGDPDWRAVVVDRAEIADLKVRASDIAGAETAVGEALSAARERLADGDPALFRALSVEAHVRLRAGRFAEAESLLRDLLARLERAGATASPDYYDRLNDLAIAVQNQGRTAEAEPILRRILAWSETHLVADDPKRASDAFNLGTLLNRMNRDVEAEKLLRAALESRRRVLPASHVNTLVNLRVLATLVLSQGRLAEARALAEEALAAEVAARGSGSRETALIERVLARIDGERGDWESARRRLASAYSVLAAGSAGAELWSLRTASDLVRIELESGRPAAAVEAAQAALDRQRAAEAPDGDVNKTLAILARALAGAGRAAEARAAAREAVAAAERAWGMAHIDRVYAIAAQAAVETAAGDAGAALARLDEADRTLAALSPGGGAARPVLESERSRALAILGRRDEALAHARTAFELRSAQAGSDSPVARAARRWVEELETRS